MKQGEVDASVKVASMEITPPQGGNSLLANPPAHTSQPRIGTGACSWNVSESTQAL